MPRQARSDTPGALHHIIVRGIERRNIFADDRDRYDFIDRLGTIVAETHTGCYAWSLIPNHFHLGKQRGPARRSYRAFVAQGIAQGRRTDLTGGGLIRRQGGWQAVKSLRPSGRHEKSDERILGDGAFVEQVLAQSQEALERRYRLQAGGVDLDYIAGRIAHLLGMSPRQVWLPANTNNRLRPAACYVFGRFGNWSSV